MKSAEMSPLFRLAIASGKAETVLSHLARGADPNSQDSSGTAALLLAASRGRQEICDILIRHGADTSASDSAGLTVIDYAKHWGFDLVSGPTSGVEMSADHAEPISQAIISTTAVVAETLHSVRHSGPVPRVLAGFEEDGELPDATAGILHGAITATLAGHEASELTKEDEVPSADGWEAEPEFCWRPDDYARVAAAQVAHETFSTPSASVDATDWSQVKASLPSGLSSAFLELPLTLRDLIADALCDGRVSVAKLRGCLGRTKSGSEYSLPVRVLLGDLGVIVETSSLDAIIDAEARSSRSGDLDEDVLAEASGLLESLLREDIETVYLRSIRSLREEAAGLQPILWARTEELRRRLAHIFARMPGGLELLEEAGALFELEQDEDPTDSAESDDYLVDVEEEEAALPDTTGAGQSSGERDHLVRRFEGLTPTELALQLVVMRLRPTVLENAARRAMEVRAEGFEDAIAFARELRSRLNRIVETNLGLVAWVAQRYRNKGMEPLDLIQEGNLGLIKAVERFDPGRGATLGTYATWWIRQSITRAMADLCRTIRVPVHLQERARKLERGQHKLHGELGRLPTTIELAEELEMSAEALIRLQRLTGTLVTRGNNVERLTREMTSGLVDPRPNPEDVMWDRRTRQEIAHQLLELTPRQERVVRLRFGIGMADEQTLEQVGETFEVTRERIRQIEAKALRRLSHPSRSKRLQGVLDVQ